ncbi:tenascin-N-like [Engraulis encrasicolus]|uniref:tenascin-N-like n=1 Tax=Engraulis encrasicolus TaxID=184585 RepID=UPI002FD63046
MPSEMDEIPHSFLVSYHTKGAEPQTITTESCSVAITGLTPGIGHTVSIFTIVQDGRKGQPAVTFIKTGIPIPENLVVGSVTATSAHLSWSMPSDMDEIPHSFLVSYHSKGAEPQTITTESCSVAITGLTPDTEYTVSIFTRLQDGRKGQPTVTSIQTGIPIPGNLVVGSVTATSAHLSWSMPSEMDEIPHSFLVSYHSKGAEPQTITTESCSVVITGLTPDIGHSVSIFTSR